MERLLLPDLIDLSYAEVMSGIQNYASQCGFCVSFPIMEGQDLAQVLHMHKADGWLNLVGGSITGDQILQVQRESIPFVLVETTSEAKCCPV